MIGYTASTEGEVNAQILDAYGKAGMTYYYYDVPGELTGWLDGNDDPVEVGTVSLAPGEGLWINAPSTAYSIQTAGQVPTTGISVALRSGFKLVVNSTPVDVDLTDIDVMGYAESTEGEVNAQILDAYGKAGMTYYYYDVPGELTGWLDGNDDAVEADAVVVAPGEALWVNAPSAAFSMVIPGVTL